MDPFGLDTARTSTGTLEDKVWHNLNPQKNNIKITRDVVITPNIYNPDDFVPETTSGSGNGSGTSGSGSNNGSINGTGTRAGELNRFSMPTPLMSSQGLDNLQMALEGAGTLESTGIADAVNAIIYAGRGQWANAGISVAE